MTRRKVAGGLYLTKRPFLSYGVRHTGKEPLPRLSPALRSVCMTQPSERRRHRIALGVLLPVIGLVAAGCGGGGGEETAAGTGGQQAGASCFKGETVKLVVPFSPGGGYDTIARAAAPQLEKELGATVVVENTPGAGGLKAANAIFTAKPDGRTIGLFAGQGIIGSVLGGAAGASFDPEKFTYIGRLAEDARVLLASPKSGFKTVEALQAAPEVRYATAGTGAADHLDATVVPVVLGIDAKIISGYKGSSETELAVTTGDVELGSGTVGTRVAGVKNKDQVPVLIIGDEPVKELPDTPVMLDLKLDADKRALAEAHVSLGEVGRSVFGPPGIPENCTTELEEAFEATLASAEFKKQMEKQDVPFEFLPGAELKQVVQKVLNAPPAYKELLKSAYKSQ